jgi:hypothetical protein
VLVRFARLTLVTVGALRTAGLALEATGRNRQHFPVILPDLDIGVAYSFSANTERPTTRIMIRRTNTEGASMDVDLRADLNAQDDDGYGWSTLADARDPDRVQSGCMLLAGNGAARPLCESWRSTMTARCTSQSSPAR